MSDPREIYLQPECCADEYEGRLWCEDDAPVDCEDGVPWTKYVIAEEYERLREEVAALRSSIDAVREIYAGMDGFIAQTAPEGYLQRIVKQMYDAALGGKEEG